jgi:hypothetical protein
MVAAHQVGAQRQDDDIGGNEEDGPRDWLQAETSGDDIEDSSSHPRKDDPRGKRRRPARGNPAVARARVGEDRLVIEAYIDRFLAARRMPANLRQDLRARFVSSLSNPSPWAKESQLYFDPGTGQLCCVRPGARRDILEIEDVAAEPELIRPRRKQGR